VLSLCSFVFKTILGLIMTSLTDAEHHKTATERAISQMRKLALAYICNNVLVYVIAMSITGNSIGDQWFNPSGLAEQAVSQVGVNTVLTPLFTSLNVVPQLLRVPYFWPFTLCTGGAANQNDLNMVYKPKQFDIAEVYANMLSTITMAFFFLPFQPFLALLCAVSLFLQQGATVVAATRYWQKPPHYHHQVQDEAEFMLGLLALVYPAMVFFVNFVLSTNPNFQQDADLIQISLACQMAISVLGWGVWIANGPLKDIIWRNYGGVTSEVDIARDVPVPDYVERCRREVMGNPPMTYEPRPDPKNEFAGYNTAGKGWREILTKHDSATQAGTNLEQFV